MRILLAVDDSKFSEAATQAVIAQARPQETEVLVIHVIEILSPTLTEEIDNFTKIEHLGEAQPNPAQALVAKTVKLLRSNGLRATAIVELGHPASRIVDAAKEWHADLIVVGSHGRRGLERFLLGSVSEIVARHAHCSVEIIRIPATR